MKNSIRPGIRLKDAKSLLFVRLGKLGDLMAASWLFRRVRGEFPHLTLGLLTLPRSKELFKYNPDLDILRLWGPWSLPVLALGERMRSWDLLVDLNDDPSRSSVLALKMIRPKKSVAFHNDLSATVFERTLPTLPKARYHALERLAVAAEALGIPARKADLRPVAYLQKSHYLHEQSLQAHRTGGNRGTRVVALNLSAGHESRYWAMEKWTGLARALLRADKGVWLKVLCAPKDGSKAEAFAAGLHSDRVLPRPGTSLNDFLTAIATSDMLITADTSAVHAAAAFGVPVLGLYPEPEWNYVSWRPLGAPNVVLRSTSGAGINAIPLSKVQAAALGFLRKTPTAHLKTIQARAKELIVGRS